VLHPILLRRRWGVEESSDIEPKVGETSQVNCFAAATLAMLGADNWRFVCDSEGTQGEIEVRLHRGIAWICKGF